MSFKLIDLKPQTTTITENFISFELYDDYSLEKIFQVI